MADGPPVRCPPCRAPSIDGMSTTEGAPPLAVTGSTGWLGGLVARGLEGHGVAQRLLVRDVARAPRVVGATVMQSAYGDSAENAEALDGVSTLFMVSASEDESGSRSIARSSTLPLALVCSTSSTSRSSVLRPMRRSRWRGSLRDRGAHQGVGMAWTFLRDNLYLEFIEAMVGSDGVIRGPAGDGRAAVVSHEDIARVAVAVLQEPSRHAGETYSLTGPEALSLAEMARLLTEVRGREVRFHDETVARPTGPGRSTERRTGRSRRGSRRTWRSGGARLDGVTDNVERFTGRRPLSLREYLAVSEGRLVVRAVVYDAIGAPPVVRYVPDPVAPVGGVVVAVHATGLCRSDWHAWIWPRRRQPSPRAWARPPGWSRRSARASTVGRWVTA